MSNSVKLFIEKAQPVLSGTSKAGNPWKKQEFIGKTLEVTPKTIVFSLFGKKLDELNIQQGYTYEISFDVESCSYVGRDGVERWTTEVSAYKADLVTMQDYQQPQSVQQPQQPAPASTVPQMQQSYNPTPMDRQADAFFGNQPAPQQQQMQPNEELPF